MEKLSDVFVLSNGCGIPCIGFGTWRAENGDMARSAVLSALDAGYRHIDTAAYYGNEESVGAAVRSSGIPRDEIFVTSKVWNDDRGYGRTIRAFEATMERLGLEYLDLYLIHWPASPSRYSDWLELNLGTWSALCELYKAGRVKAIGVSNFKPHHLEALMNTSIHPMVNQIEFHPGFMQKETLDFCQSSGIQVEAWSPRGKGGRGQVLDNPTVMSISAKYGVSPAQLCIRWALQHQVLPLPKSVTPSRIRENADVFSFQISQEDMAAIDALPYMGTGRDPDDLPDKLDM